MAAFLEVLLENLDSLMKREIGLIIGADEEMRKLSSTLTTIQAVLEDAEDKQFESKPIRNWLRKLNDLAFEIDDLLDECGIEVSKLDKKNNRIIRSLKKILYNHKIGRRIKEMVNKLDAIAAEREKFHFRESSIERQTVVAATRAVREMGSVLNEPVLGRDEEKEKIVDILVNQIKDCPQLSILPIIGLGGMGKTTLARSVYNDRQITEHFDLKLWVCVSDYFDSKILIKAMLESATETGSSSDLMNLDSLECRLSKLLDKKRYLLVLDDVWNDDQEKWAKLKMVLAAGSTGASIVVTTRSQKVADIMRTLPTHRLSGLSDEICWLLFKKRAFGEQFEEPPSNLEAIGREIVKKCGGVPLAAKALGGLLRFKSGEKEWNYVKKSELWKLEEEETSILPSLRLSYRHLPLVLRRCFAYCALFPKDTEIDKEELIHLWMAHGCILSNGNKEVEDIGHGIWNELVVRSLLQLEASIIYRGKTVLKMHDLVHDLALSIMESQVPGAHTKNSTTQSNSKIRQVHVRGCSSTGPTSIQIQVSPFTSLVNFNHARMLHAGGYWPVSEAFLSSIGKLKQLRHLNLSDSSIQALPNTICDLQNLLILNLKRCRKLVRLPKNMRYVDTLRHLFLGGCSALIEMPTKIGHLTSLKTLSLFIVGDKIGNQLGELEHLDLGGKLKIKHLERVKDQVDARKANLREKSNLQDLILKWEGENASESRERMDKMVLEALEPCSNIQTLMISGFRGKVFPLWMENSTINNLIEIEIKNCPNCLHLPPLGGLPQLKSLKLVKLIMVEFLTEDEVEGGKSFPSLEKLHLGYLPNLKGFSKKEVREMSPDLGSLEKTDCPSLRFAPLFPSLKELWVFICSNWTLSSISKLDNLTSLTVIFSKKMTSIPKEALESLPNLNELNIWASDEHSLPAEALHGLKSLTRMRIRMREGVRCLLEEWFPRLTTLENLYIWYCCDLIELPDEIKYLHSLKSLTLHQLPKLGCLPEGLQHLHSLEDLLLHNLAQLNSLPAWLDKLTSLNYLTIWNCPRIASLPSNIQRMTSLQTLDIWCCSAELKRRCEEGTGEDWHIIAHIPYLHIR